MCHVGLDEVAHALWKSRRLLALVSLSFGVGETICSRGMRKAASFEEQLIYKDKNIEHTFFNSNEGYRVFSRDVIKFLNPKLKSHRCFYPH